MKKEYILIGVLLLVVILLTTMAKPIKKALSRGYRNNNPGNIRLSGTKWQGEIVGDDKAFKKFKSMAYGYRAIFVLLRTYINKGYDTIEKIINRYAPPHENVTTSYVGTVSKMTGIDPNKKISFLQADDLKRIVAAISYVENGVKANENQINEGFTLLT